MTEKRPIARLPLPDALRGMAAIGVVFHHEQMLYGDAGAFSRAYLAVDFFFMLSGFVLTLAFEPKLNGTLPSKTMRPADFIMMRLARLWPVLAVGVLIGAAWRLSVGATRDLWLLTLSGLTLIPFQRGRGGLFQLDGPQWSLMFEVIGNIAHALVLRRLPDRILLAFVALCGAGLVWATVDWGSVGLGDTMRNWQGGFVRVGFSYGLGIWLGRQFARGRGPVPQSVAWAGALLLPLCMFTAQYWPLGVVAGDLLAVLILFPPALWCATHVAMAGWSARLADWLGRSSYPVYVLHGPLLIWGASLARRHAEMAGMIRPATLLVIAALSVAVMLSPLPRGIPLRRRP